MTGLVYSMLWIAVISVGILAGVYFTFSAFLMRSLDAIEKPAGMIAMQSINRVILRSAFLPVFFTSSAVCIVLAVVAILDLSGAGALPMFVGSTTFVIGMFFVTVVRNVPLNNALEATVAEDADGEEMWHRYMQRWVAWNHVRTVCCTVAMALLIVALVARS